MKQRRSRSKTGKSQSKTYCTLDTSNINQSQGLIGWDQPTLGFESSRAKRSSSKEGVKSSKQGKRQHRSPLKRHNLSQGSIEGQRETPWKKGKTASGCITNSRLKTEQTYVGNSTNLTHMRSVSRKIQYPLDPCYRFDGYQFVKTICNNRDEKVLLVRSIQKKSRHVLFQAKSEAMKKAYLRQIKARTRLLAKPKRKDKPYVLQMNRSYKDSKSVTIVYEPFRGRLSDDINLFALLREEPQLIIDLITGLARAINWLSEQGIVHAAIQPRSVFIDYCLDDLTGIKIKSIKLGNFSECFKSAERKKCVQMKTTVRTPPEIINLKIFHQGGQFDRDYLELANSDQQWTADVWALGILLLQIAQGNCFFDMDSLLPNCSGLPNSDWTAANAKTTIPNGDSLSTDKQCSILKENHGVGCKKSLETLATLLRYQRRLQLDSVEILGRFPKQIECLVTQMLSQNPRDRPHPLQIVRIL